MPETLTNLPTLLAIAWLLPLVSFTIVCLSYSIPQMMGTRAPYGVQKYGAYVACSAIIGGFVLSLYGLLFCWLPAHPVQASGHGHHGEEHHAADGHAANGHGAEHGHDDEDHGDDHAEGDHAEGDDHDHATDHGDEADTEEEEEEEESAAGHADHNNAPPPYITGDWYALGIFGSLKLTIGYYIDALTVAMFVVVTFIASCVHVYAIGYMHDELHDYTDHEVTMSDGEHLHRPGRFHRFFQYLSLFSFSMLGIVISGNLAMTFVFWELVGICSYFLIGFYIERHSASTAANKAFIVNRVGDFGMLIGLMAIWSSLGTFNYGDMPQEEGAAEPGMFSLLRSEADDYALKPTDGMIIDVSRSNISAVAAGHSSDEEAMQAAISAEVATLREDESTDRAVQWLLLVAGIGVFCGCVGKSAQFPLHVWLPDAMEGPTPVSALVHSATMVAAGVYLVGRSYPLFTPETLLVIAVIGCITLFVAATIAVTATDIKRVLAYSTVSQLGYMMLALGLGGWVAGLFHLVTHAFFKSLLFLCSGSVIHAVHSNEMTDMGGLRKKMPITAYTMLVGCLAIIGAGIPLTGIGLSGYYSKDAIIEQALSYAQRNGTPLAWLLFIAPVVGAIITAFYMFRLWYMTFAGEPRDKHRYDHAHESPPVMYIPLIILAVMAVVAGWGVPFTDFSCKELLEQARPVGTLATTEGVLMEGLIIPNEHDSHQPQIVVMAGLLAFFAAFTGLAGATAVYLWGHIKPQNLKTALRPLYELSWNKWWFDELYHFIFVLPTHACGHAIALFDKFVIDGLINQGANVVTLFSQGMSYLGDTLLIDRSVDGLAGRTWSLGNSLRAVQTGRLRQYVMMIALGTVVLFIATSVWKFALAG